jgi:hypothetical protein
MVVSDRDPNKMDDQMRQDWSRHYDTIQWHVITIFTAGVGALFAASFADEKGRLWPEIAGVALSVLGIFYVASFRSFRSNLHAEITNCELRDFLSNLGRYKLLRQWHAFVLSFAVVDGALILKLAEKISCFRVVFWGVLIPVLLVLFLVWNMGQSESQGVKTTPPPETRTLDGTHEPQT